MICLAIDWGLWMTGFWHAKMILVFDLNAEFESNSIDDS